MKHQLEDARVKEVILVAVETAGKLFKKGGSPQPRGEYNKVGKDLSCDNSGEMLPKNQKSPKSGRVN